jgi:hypothetical protein
MSRNGTGIYSVMNPILIGALRSSSAVNADFTDEGEEITNTLPIDGQAGMSGQFKAVAGSVTVPGISFGADRNLGFRRMSADSMSWCVGNQDRMYNDADGVMYHSGAVDIAGALVVDGTCSGSSDCGAIEVLSGTGLLRRLGTASWSLDDGTYNVTAIFDAVGAQIGTAQAFESRIPTTGTITGVSVIGDQDGSAVVGIAKCAYADYPGSLASIVGSTPPTLATADTYDDTSLTGWTTAVTAGDCLRFTLSSISVFERLTVNLKIKRYI